MALSINPLAKLLTTTQESISQATNEGIGNIPSVDQLGKFNLDSLTNQLGGGIGSGLNGLSAGNNPFSNLTGASLENSLGGGSRLLGGAQSALGGIGNPIQSTISSSINSLQSVTGSTSNLTADISGSLNKLTGGGLAGGFQEFAGSISKAAGNLNNILSLVRGANLPAGGELFKQTGSPIKLQPNAKDDWRVRITCQWNIFDSPLFKLLENTGGVVWPFLPTVSYSSTANYNQIDTVHSNYPYYAYKNSQISEISITGQFSAETATDAAYWIAATTFFRTATKMFFGQGENAGNPPLICNLTGYGASIFDKIPVIIRSFNIDLPNDVNYIKCDTFGTSTWVPVLSDIAVTLTPVYNRSRLRKFSLRDFAKGRTADPDGVGYL